MASGVTQTLSILALGGMLGMIGQATRAIVGMKKMNDDTQASDADLFMASRLVVSLMIGFVAGVVAVLSMSALSDFDPSAPKQLLGIAAAGYVGSDIIEAFSTTLSKTAPAVRAADVDQGEPAPAPDPGPMPSPRPGPTDTSTKTLSGAMSNFGGPDDRGMGADEGLALLDESDLSEFPGLFLPQQPPGTTGLGRRLDPNAAYIACRWNYDETSKSYLKGIRVQVLNPANGAVGSAQPVDWGPAEHTHRVADLSPGLARQLGLATDDICKVTIPLPRKNRVDPDPEILRAHLRVMSLDEIRKNFGTFEYREGPKAGAITITDGWEAKNIETITIDALAKLTEGGKVECHKAIAAPLRAVVDEIVRRGLLDRIRTWDGTFVPRHKSWDSNRSLSAHSWGIALDINVHWNAYGAEPAPKGATGSVMELVSIFEAQGFAWGGFFRPDSYRDGMHFEYCKAVEAPTA